MNEAVKISNAMLKEVLTDALVLRPQGGRDFDTFMTPGFVEVGASGLWRNYPEGAYRYGVLLVLGLTTFVAQVYFPHANAGGGGVTYFYWRVHYAGSSTAQPSGARWKKVAGEVMTAT